MPGPCPAFQDDATRFRLKDRRGDVEDVARPSTPATRVDPGSSSLQRDLRSLARQLRSGMPVRRRHPPAAWSCQYGRIPVGYRMHFDIDATGTALPLEARAYLEYRLFSRLSLFGADVFAVRVRLRERAAVGQRSVIDCRVQVLLRPTGEAVVDTSADWLYGAIDQGAEAAGAAVDQLFSTAV